jgi:hypothetical protein
MPRPIKNNAEYFSHDADMRNDDRIKAVRKKFKSAGYGVWNMLIEYLTDKDFFMFEYTDLTIELMAGDFDEEPEVIRGVIDYCITLGLLQKEDGFIRCKTLEKRLEQVLLKRKRAKSVVTVTETTQSKGKKSKGKNIDINIYGSGKVFVTVRAVYANDRPDKIYELEKFFEAKGQLLNLTESGMVRFTDFIKTFAGQVFNDYNHLYSAFRKFCVEGAPIKIIDPKASDPFSEAEYNLTLWHLEEWKKFYMPKIQKDAKFKERFKHVLI